MKKILKLFLLGVELLFPETRLCSVFDLYSVSLLILGKQVCTEEGKETSVNPDSLKKLLVRLLLFLLSILGGIVLPHLLLPNGVFVGGVAIPYMRQAVSVFLILVFLAFYLPSFIRDLLGR